jgi:hypothetical protein
MLLIPPPPPAQVLPAPAPEPLRAQYAWGYAGADGEGKGTLGISLAPASGSLVLELHGLGERLMLLQGSTASGYRLQIPRRQVDRHSPGLAGLPLPFLPEAGTVEALFHLLTEGKGPGVTVTKRDALGPVKLRYAGRDDQGKELLVWLTRTRWERGEATR